MKIAIYPGSFDPITNGHLGHEMRVHYVEVERIGSGGFGA